MDGMHAILHDQRDQSCFHASELCLQRSMDVCHVCVHAFTWTCMYGCKLMVCLCLYVDEGVYEGRVQGHEGAYLFEEAGVCV